MKKAIALALATTVAAVTAATAGAGSTAVAASQAINCKTGTIKIAFLTPLTGDAGFLGQEQAELGQVRRQDARPEARAEGAARARRLAARPGTRLVARPEVRRRQERDGDHRPVDVGCRGRHEQDVLRRQARAHLALRDAHLADQGRHEGGDRGVLPRRPGRLDPGPVERPLHGDKLGAKKVVVVDSQEPYSVGLADAVQATLKAKGVTVQRESVTINTTDFSSIVTKVPGDADFVFFGTQQPPKAQTLRAAADRAGQEGEALLGRRRRTTRRQFKVPGSYVSNFAGPIDGIAYNKAIVDGWKKDNPGSELGSFGPPTYGAVQVALNAIKQACTQEDRRHHRPVRRAQEGQGREGQELDPRWRLQVLHQDERPVQRELLHLPDPGQRQLQASSADPSPLTVYADGPGLRPGPSAVLTR